jgi:hypothetical protein
MWHDCGRDVAGFYCTTTGCCFGHVFEGSDCDDEAELFEKFVYDTTPYSDLREIPYLSWEPILLEFYSHRNSAGEFERCDQCADLHWDLKHVTCGSARCPAMQVICPKCLYEACDECGEPITITGDEK